MKKRIKFIEHVYIAGKARKVFEVWGLRENTWVFLEKGNAPQKIANKSLLDYHLNNSDTF